MSMQELLPLAVLFSSLLPGLAIFALPESWIGCAHHPQPVWRLRQAGPGFPVAGRGGGRR